jgi:hypothetical protein
MATCWKTGLIFPTGTGIIILKTAFIPALRPIQNPGSSFLGDIAAEERS